MVFTLNLTRDGRPAGTITISEDSAAVTADVPNLSGDARITGVRGFGYDTAILDVSVRHFVRDPQVVVGMHPHILDSAYGQSAIYATVASVTVDEPATTRGVR